MSRVTEQPADATTVALEEVRAFLRIGNGDEDALLSAMIRTATDCAERFIGSPTIIRHIGEVLPTTGVWTALSVSPVASISMVEGLPADGAAHPLPVSDYAIDIDASSRGWVRVIRAGAAGRIRVRYLAGLGNNWNAVPEPIRHGIVRLAAHLFTTNDGDGTMPPAVVAALWRPYRRMRLT